MKFKVGDLVICIERDLRDNNGSIGEVVRIGAGKGRDWPVHVSFGGRFIWSYTGDGFRVDETQPFNRIEPATKLHRLLAGLE